MRLERPRVGVHVLSAVEEALGTKEVAHTRAARAAGEHESLVERGVRGVLHGGGYGAPALTVEMELVGDRFADRGLAVPVLAAQERALRVELPRLLEGP